MAAKSKIVDDIASAVDTNKSASETTVNTETKNTNRTVALKDTDEISVISLIPNVSYFDKTTGERYEWTEVGQREALTYSILKNIWRNHKNYFKNMLLKPLDDRVIKAFGLSKDYNNYEFLMKPTSYIKDNIGSVGEVISSTPNGLKYTIATKIKSMVASGEITDVFVIRNLERRFNMDLVSLIQE